MPATFLALFSLVMGSLPPSGEAAAARPFFLLADSMDAATKAWIIAALIAVPTLAATVAGWKKLTGQSETSTSHISGGPVEVSAKIEFVPRADFIALHQRVDRHEEAIGDLERHLSGQMNAKFHELNRERSVSIAGLHKKIEDEGQRKDLKLDAVERHNQARFEKMIEAIGELRGEVHALIRKGEKRA